MAEETIIKFKKEELKKLNDDGTIEVQKVNGKTQYVQNDIIGLNSLLSKFDTRIHTVIDWKISLRIKDKIMKCFLEQKEEVSLNKEEIKFLREYIREIKVKEAKNEVLVDFELRTLFAIAEQLGIIPVDSLS